MCLQIHAALLRESTEEKSAQFFGTECVSKWEIIKKDEDEDDSCKVTCSHFSINKAYTFMKETNPCEK